MTMQLSLFTAVFIRLLDEISYTVYRLSYSPPFGIDTARRIIQSAVILLYRSWNSECNDPIKLYSQRQISPVH